MALQLCELETQMHSMKMLHFMSPQVSTTLMWFLKEFTRTYLFMNEKNYQQVKVIEYYEGWNYLFHFNF